MRGKPVTEGMALEGFNTKLQPETKQMIVALTAVKKMAGHRELIEDMLEVYRDSYPQDWHKAACMVALLNGEEPPDAPPTAAAAEPKAAEEPLQTKPAAPKQMAVYTCKLEDGRQAIIATTGRSKAAQLLGVTYRYFMVQGGEYQGDETGRFLALRDPGQVFAHLDDPTKGLAGITWEPIERQAKAYRG
ncbi:MAG: hypothetical protein ACYC0N_00660 [Carboxydocellales bacterium]